MARGSASYRFCQWVLRCAGRGVWKIRVEGLERVPVQGAVIIAPTHESFLDPLVVGAYLPRGLRYMARRTLFVKTTNGAERRRPFATYLGRTFGVIEVDLDGGGRDAVKKCLDALAQGDAVLIFPEGTRSLGGNVKEFQAGVGLLALRSGAPVVPVSVDGTRRIWPKGRRYPRFSAGPVRLVYGEPVKYERPRKADEVAADLRGRILDLRGAGQQAAARDGADAHGGSRGSPSG